MWISYLFDELLSTPKRLKRPDNRVHDLGNSATSVLRVDGAVLATLQRSGRVRVAITFIAEKVLLKLPNILTELSKAVKLN
jgi:hypothetical protein